MDFLKAPRFRFLFLSISFITCLWAIPAFGQTPPANDDWANAIEITDISDYCSGSTSDFTNVGATSDGPTSSVYATSLNVWFKFSPTSTGEANILVRRGGIRKIQLTLF